MKTEAGTSPARASRGDVYIAAGPVQGRGGADCTRGGATSVYDGPMLTLYDNAFSPFARKVRLALGWKGIDHEVVDGLALVNRDKLTPTRMPAQLERIFR